MEQLQMQEHGSIKVEPVSLEDAYDRNYKPGLFLQVRNWIEDKTESLCGIDEHFGRVGSVYSKIAGFEF
uniref:Uncharacterized protein n=1 Tax=Leptospira ellisii TaxID=2023197 RepID=A0A2N0B2Q4_9LEPT|nr:hypothetical protein CH379_22265 [Leptospira ellisii]